MHIFITYFHTKNLNIKLFEAWSGHKPNVSHFRVFGSKDWAIIPTKKRKELKPQRKDSIVMEKNSYGLGCTTIDIETPEINPFPIWKRNTTSNTKGSVVVYPH